MVKQLLTPLTRFTVLALALTLMVTTLSAQAYSKVEASIDKNPVEVGQSFILTVTADDNIANNAFDSSPLMRDFVVGNTSVSSREYSYNSVASRSTVWTTLLIARQAGKKIIPPLSVNNLSTQPIALVVVDKGQSHNNAQKEIFITTEVSAKELYVQQLLTLTVKLHFSVSLYNYHLSDPSMEGANISQIGEFTESEQIINGVRYIVREYSYLLIPQKSGNFSLKTPAFSAEIAVQSRRRSGFMSFREKKSVSAIADDINITVKAIPLDYKGAWLPAEQLRLNQEWQPEVASFTVGEPITRIITLSATGLIEEQLPEITMPLQKGLNIYPDQPKLHTRVMEGKVVSQKVQKFALVAEKPGVYDLPEIKIPWWNTVTNKKEFATISAQTVTVLASENATANQSEKNSGLTNNLSENTETNSNEHNHTNNLKNQQTESSAFVRLITISALVISLISSSAALYLWRANKKLTAQLAIYNDVQAQGSIQKVPAGSASNSHMNSAYNASTQKYSADTIIKACKDNAGEQVLQLLPSWLVLHSQSKSLSINNIDDVINEVADIAFSEDVHHLQNCYFAKEKTPWQGKNLAKTLTRIEKMLVKASSEKGAKKTFSLNP